MLHDGANAIVVDPGDAAPVLAALQAQGLQLVGILVTHHHADHIGGVDELRSVLQGPVWGPAGETMPQPCVPLQQGDSISVLGRRFDVIDVPGHTAGHIAYFESRAAQGSPLEAPLLFCGDTLFSAGCGRLFEGTPQQMHQSLQKLAALPPETQVCCTHEYTLSNLRFAHAVEPDNADIQAHQQRCQLLREQGLPTLPSRISLELQINPFLRCHLPTVAAQAQQAGARSTDPVQVLAALREWKNRF